MGFKIKEKRTAMRLSQEELAEKSGVSRVTISALENGTMRSTTTRTLIAIARALESTVDQIFTDDDD